MKLFKRPKSRAPIETRESDNFHESVEAPLVPPPRDDAEVVNLDAGEGDIPRETPPLGADLNTESVEPHTDRRAS